MFLKKPLTIVTQLHTFYISVKICQQINKCQHIYIYGYESLTKSNDDGKTSEVIQNAAHKSNWLALRKPKLGPTTQWQAHWYDGVGEVWGKT